MRILIWHGWLLEGSGSNVAAARLAQEWRRRGHDVVLLCQERHPERFPFIDAAGTVGRTGVSTLDGEAPTGAAAGGRIVLLRPEIGPLLPVFVYDEYEGFEVKRFVELTDDELERYVSANVDALRAAAAWLRPEAAIVGHAVAGPAIARRALGAGTYVAKLHGSDLEYAVRMQPRYRDLAAEGLSGAGAIIGGSRDVLARAAALIPALPSHRLVIPPGVDVEGFRPRDRREALLEAARKLDADPRTGHGRPGGASRSVEDRLEREDGSGLDRLAASYDQTSPDRDAARRLRGLAEDGGPIVGYLGKLIPQKGVELLLQALALTPGPVAGLIVGFGTFREWLEALLVALDGSSPERATWLASRSPMRIDLTPEQIRASHGLQDRLTFTGRLDHRYAPLALAAMDVLVVPSILDEAFGMVAVEGAAAGALPLVSRHSGLAEVAAALEAAVDGPGLFSFEPGPDAARRIAAGIERLLSLPAQERARLKTAVSLFARSEWTWERAAERLLAAASGAARPTSST
jgi:glycosyltransferase involved in cell wall biosynthesis